MNQLTKIDDEATELTNVAPPFTLSESTAIGLARAEIDVQITTAKKYPRSIANAAKSIRALVTMDQEAAAECMYALPRGGKPIQGPSIRLAEIIFQCWGNARCDARVIDVDRDEKVVIAQGIYHDLETNSASRSTVRRRIVDSKGRIFNDDMITVTGNAACSIAKRNAILAGVPKTVWNRAYMDAREVVAGTIQTLAVSRDKAISAFANFGVTPEQIFPAIGVGGAEEITLDHIPVLRGMFSAIKNGEATVEEMFSPRKAPSTHEKVANPLSDVPDHDPETGEVGDGAGSKEAKGKAASGDAGAAAGSKKTDGAPARTSGSPATPQAPTSGANDATKPDPTKIALLEKLRAKASKGTDALRRAMANLTDAESKLLTDDDHDEIGAVAEEADGKGGG